MKKIIALTLALLLALTAFTGCRATAVVGVTQPTETTKPTETQPLGDDAVKTGLSMTTSLSSSKNAGEEAGLAQADVTMVAVTVDENGVIVQCVIDGVQAKVNFDSTGAITSDTNADVLSKNQLGTDYGMGKYSPIGKEWNQQAQALADYVEGKTLEEVKGIAITEEGKAADADLSSSVTIAIAGFIPAIEAAVMGAQNLGAKASDTLKLTTTTSVASSKSATAEEAGLAQADCYAAALTLEGETITSAAIDSVQAKVNFDNTGAITTDLTAQVLTKNQLGADYGMGKYSPIGKEWNEQTASFCQYITGKTIDQVLGIAINQDNKPADADLASSVTISIGSFLELVSQAK